MTQLRVFTTFLRGEPAESKNALDLQRFHWTSYDINKRFLGDKNGEYLWENARKNRERLYEDPELLAEYYALYFKETFENNKVAYYRHEDGFKRAMIRKIAEKMNNAL